jgi:hypothetical protein
LPFLSRIETPIEIGRLDYVCGLFSVGAIILWALTKTPAIAIILSIIADALAAVPTLVKSWHHPETEDWTVCGRIHQPAHRPCCIQTLHCQRNCVPLYLMLINAALVLVIGKDSIFRPFHGLGK